MSFLSLASHRAGGAFSLATPPCHKWGTSSMNVDIDMDEDGSSSSEAGEHGMGQGVSGGRSCLREVGNFRRLVLHEPNGQSQEATHGGSACCAVRPGDNVLLCGDASLSGQHNEVCERAGFKPQKSEQMHSDHVDGVCRADIANRSLKLKRTFCLFVCFLVSDRLFGNKQT